MRIRLGSSMVGGAWMALALLAAFSVAQASSGRISFSGAVVEPTCAVAAGHLATSLAAQPADARSPARLVCNRTATDPGRSYSRVVIDLDVAHAADDRLLSYMLSRAPAAAGSAPYKLVVRTYD
jgi:hypothetical protein